MAVTALVVLASLLKWLLLLLTLPLLVELFVLTAGSMLPARRPDTYPDEEPQHPPLTRLMAIVPSHNEELSIARCIESLIEASGSAQNIVVIAHNCTDATAEIAARIGARVEIVNDPTRAGKGHALKHGFDFAFSQCGAEAVMIIDADTTVSPNLFQVALKRLAQSPVIQCRYQVRNHAASWRTSLRSLAFTGINLIRPRGRDRLGLSSGIFGNGFAMRKEVLELVAYNAHSIVEDMEFHLALVEHGYKVKFVTEACVLGDMPVSAETSASQHSRWQGGRIRLLSDWGPRLLRRIVQGRLALAEPLIDLLGLPLAFEIFALAILLLFPSMHLYVFAAFCVIVVHVGVAVLASPSPKHSLGALLRAPIYLVTRLGKLTSTIRASDKGTAWVRTTRDKAVDTKEILAGKSVPRPQEHP
jgi:cellulose synthase/poly-beta-1,6-N-acetylglucosamine synthase-like glycosyltransferase